MKIKQIALILAATLPFFFGCGNGEEEYPTFSQTMASLEGTYAVRSGENTCFDGNPDGQGEHDELRVHENVDKTTFFQGAEDQRVSAVGYSSNKGLVEIQFDIDSGNVECWLLFDRQDDNVEGECDLGDSKCDLAYQKCSDNPQESCPPMP